MRDVEFALAEYLLQGCDEFGQNCWGAGDLNVIDMLGSDEVETSVSMLDDQLVARGTRSGAEDVVSGVSELDAEAP